MLAFMNCFQKENALLTLKGKSFSKSECKQLGFGNQKRVYGLKNGTECFFVPSKIGDGWDNQIQAEKGLCDQILSLGLKAQKFEIVPLTVQETAHGPSYTLNVLLTKSFNAVAEDEHLAIYNVKSSDPNGKFTGDPVTIYDGKLAYLNNKQWNQQILEKIIKEYALALTYKLPIHQVTDPDDSVHFCFELQKDKNQPPKIRYMFWDVLGDFSGLELPIVPNMCTLKTGLRFKEQYGRVFDPQKGIKSLVNGIACALIETAEVEKLGFENEFESCKAIEKALLSAITENMLNDALTHARQQACGFLKGARKEYIKIAREIPLAEQQRHLFDLVCSSISTGEVECVKAALALSSNLATFLRKYGEKIYVFAKDYDDKNITNYLSSQIPSFSAKVPSSNTKRDSLSTPKQNPSSDIRKTKNQAQGNKLSTPLKSKKIEASADLHSTKMPVAKTLPCAPSHSESNQINKFIVPTVSGVLTASTLFYLGLSMGGALLSSLVTFLGMALIQYKSESSAKENGENRTNEKAKNSSMRKKPLQLKSSHKDHFVPTKSYLPSAQTGKKDDVDNTPVKHSHRLTRRPR